MKLVKWLKPALMLALTLGNLAAVAGNEGTPGNPGNPDTPSGQEVQNPPAESPLNAWLPAGVSQYKAVVVLLYPADQKNAHLADSAFTYEAWADWCKAEKIALAVFEGSNAKQAVATQAASLQHGLQQLATRSRHPELQNAPLMLLGYKDGATLAAGLAQLWPQRVAAWMGNKAPSYHSFTAGPGAQVPGIIITGGRQSAASQQSAQHYMTAARSAGALLGTLEETTHDDEFGDAATLGLAFFDWSHRARINAGKLKPVAAASGYMLPTQTKGEEVVQPQPAKAFKGNAAQASWFASEDLAVLVKNLRFYGDSLYMSSNEHGGTYAPSRQVSLRADTARLPDWHAIYLYDGARQLGKVDRKSAAMMTKADKPGVHVYYMVGYGRDGQRSARSQPMRVYSTANTPVAARTETIRFHGKPTLGNMQMEQHGNHDLMLTYKADRAHELDIMVVNEAGHVMMRRRYGTRDNFNTMFSLANLQAGNYMLLFREDGVIHKAVFRK